MFPLILCKIGNHSISTLTGRKDQEQMLHNAAFHQGIHCLLRFQNNQIIFENFTLMPLDIHNLLYQSRSKNPVDQQVINSREYQQVTSLQARGLRLTSHCIPRSSVSQTFFINP